MEIVQSVILITAAGSPIGKAISLHFASLGAKLALVDIDKVQLDQTYRACKACGAQCEAYNLAQQDEASIKHIFDSINQRFGSIDVLINYTLGAELPALFSPASVDKFSHSMIELATTFFAFGKQAAHYMRSCNRKGVIVNLITQPQDSDQLLNFDSTKAMVSGLTQSWAKELSDFNIRVGGVVPITLGCDCSDCSTNHVINQHLQYEIVRSAEYIVTNDYFNGRILEAEI
ncbi:SDR family oxidoreductase [Photobacterium kagoshimensis]|uniref:SDR family oxidoreductase n=1 Tax=Photobacterium kagoshimensis TaxID=2910242 RepID=UPI003D09D615